MGHGGARAGAGKPKGSVAPSTLAKEMARQRLRERVIAELDPMLDAQIANAKGIKYLVAREKKSGKFRRLSEAQAVLEVGGESELEIIEVWEKDPSIQAFTDLMNRTIDKPVEQVTADMTANVTYRWKDSE